MQKIAKINLLADTIKLESMREIMHTHTHTHFISSINSINQTFKKNGFLNLLNVLSMDTNFRNEQA